MHCVREVYCICATLEELVVSQSCLTVSHHDNLGAISWTKEIKGFLNVKNIGIRYHYVRDGVDSMTVEVQYTSDIENKVDGLMKSLVTTTFKKFRTGLMCLPIMTLLSIEEAC